MREDTICGINYIKIITLHQHLPATKGLKGDDFGLK